MTTTAKSPIRKAGIEHGRAWRDTLPRVVWVDQGTWHGYVANWVLQKLDDDYREHIEDIDDFEQLLSSDMDDSPALTAVLGVTRLISKDLREKGRSASRTAKRVMQAFDRQVFERSRFEPTQDGADGFDYLRAFCEGVFSGK